MSLEFYPDFSDIVDFSKYIAGARKTIPYAVIFKPMFKSNLTLVEIVVYSIIYSIVSAKIIVSGVKPEYLEFELTKHWVPVSNEDINLWFGVNELNESSKFSQRIGRFYLSRVLKSLESYELIEVRNKSDKTNGKKVYREIRIKKNMGKYQKETLNGIINKCDEIIVSCTLNNQDLKMVKDCKKKAKAMLELKESKSKDKNSSKGKSKYKKKESKDIPKEEVNVNEVDNEHINIFIDDECVSNPDDECVSNPDDEFGDLEF